jgi:hypothetical protein
VPEKITHFRRMWERLGDGWVALFDDLDEAQLTLLIGHLRRTAEFGTVQVARLRAGGDGA